MNVLFKESLPQVETNDFNTDKGEVGGSSPPRPTITSKKYAGILTFSISGISLTKLICQPFVNFSNS